MTSYQLLLEEVLLDMYADDSVFRQDGAPYHVSLFAISYLEQKKIVFLMRSTIETIKPKLN